MPNKPILITGCQRSGTTLMHLILDSHPDISSIDENQFRYPALNTYLNAPLSPFVCFKLPRYAQILEQFSRGLPGIKTIWCIRDPLDVVWSMIKLKETLDKNHSVPWAAHPLCAQMEIVNSFYALDEVTRQKLSENMNNFKLIANKNSLERSKTENIFTGALCWTIKNALLERYKKENIDFLAVKYEKLVTSPKQTVMSILEYIGVGWSNDVLRHHEKHSGMSTGSTLSTRPIDTRGVGQGIQKFTQEEAVLIRRVCSFTPSIYY